MIQRVPVLKRKAIIGAIVGFLILTYCGCRDQPEVKSKDFPASVLGDPLEDSSHGKVPRLNPGLSLHVEQRGCWILRVKPRSDVVYPMLKVRPDPEKYYVGLRGDLE